MSDPFPKKSQLSRGPKRPGRIKATPLDWSRIRREKLGTCRCYGLNPCDGRAELHHVVPRSWLGDDVADNLVPLCTKHHRFVTVKMSAELEALAESLSDSEYAYVIDKLGEGGMERLFGVFTCTIDESGGAK